MKLTATLDQHTNPVIRRLTDGLPCPVWLANERRSACREFESLPIPDRTSRGSRLPF